MSIKIMSQVWDDTSLSSTDKLLLLSLADHANDDGVCYPSVARLVVKTSLKERTIQTAIKRLIAAGKLEVEVGGGRKNCNLYTIKTPQQMHPAADAPPHMTAETPHMTAENPAADAPEPSITTIEPSDNPPLVPQDDPDPPKPKKARLPEDWVPSEEDREYALSLNLTEDEIKEIADDFHAYWTDRTDAGGRKSARGWRQTWRNRCRDVAPRTIRNRRLSQQAYSGGNQFGGGIAGAVARRQFGGQV